MVMTVPRKATTAAAVISRTTDDDDDGGVAAASASRPVEIPEIVSEVLRQLHGMYPESLHSGTLYVNRLWFESTLPFLYESLTTGQFAGQLDDPSTIERHDQYAMHIQTIDTRGMPAFNVIFFLGRCDFPRLKTLKLTADVVSGDMAELIGRLFETASLEQFEFDTMWEKVSNAIVQRLLRAGPRLKRLVVNDYDGLLPEYLDTLTASLEYLCVPNGRFNTGVFSSAMRQQQLKYFELSHIDSEIPHGKFVQLDTFICMSVETENSLERIAAAMPTVRHFEVGVRQIRTPGVVNRLAMACPELQVLRLRNLFLSADLINVSQPVYFPNIKIIDLDVRGQINVPAFSDPHLLALISQAHQLETLKVFVGTVAITTIGMRAIGRTCRNFRELKAIQKRIPDPATLQEFVTMDEPVLFPYLEKTLPFLPLSVASNREIMKRHFPRLRDLD